MANRPCLAAGDTATHTAISAGRRLERIKVTRELLCHRCIYDLTKCEDRCGVRVSKVKRVGSKNPIISGEFDFGELNVFYYRNRRHRTPNTSHDNVDDLAWKPRIVIIFLSALGALTLIGSGRPKDRKRTNPIKNYFFRCHRIWSGSHFKSTAVATVRVLANLRSF